MSKSVTILYVDDEPINLQLFRINLGKKYNVYTASCGADALAILADKATAIDVVVSDFRMPKMNGVEFINAVKSEHPSICCYMLTGFDSCDEISEALKNGIIKKCFRKPFNIVEIDYEMNALSRGA